MGSVNRNKIREDIRVMRHYLDTISMKYLFRNASPKTIE